MALCRLSRYWTSFPKWRHAPIFESRNLSAKESCLLGMPAFPSEVLSRGSEQMGFPKMEVTQQLLDGLAGGTGVVPLFWDPPNCCFSRRKTWIAGAVCQRWIFLRQFWPCCKRHFDLQAWTNRPASSKTTARKDRNEFSCVFYLLTVFQVSQMFSLFPLLVIASSIFPALLDLMNLAKTTP